MPVAPAPFASPLSPLVWAILACILTLAVCVPIVLARRRIGWEIVTYACITFPLGAVGAVIWALNRDLVHFAGIWYVVGLLLVALSCMGLLIGLIEFGLLRLLALFRVGAIARVTYYEALLQPFTLLVVSVGVITIGVAARLGYFTYNEDFKMYRDVAASFVFIFALPIMIFSSTKVIDEEIENRTMLTLMSKPVSRTEVVLGKYLGVLLIVLACVGVLGIMAGFCSYMRYFDDMSIDFRLATAQGKEQLFYDNWKAILALIPSFILTFLQLATLAAISVAVSTRFGLAVNIAAVMLIYIAANLARFIGNAHEVPALLRPLIAFFTYLLPGLTLLDLNQRLVFGTYMLGKDDWGIGLPTYGMIWQYVGLSTLYSLFYIGAVLSFGVALFRSRELS